MANQITGHLDEERLIAAIIDEEGLDSAAHRHLLDCSACRAQKEALEGRLARFGELSRDNAPLPLNRPGLARAESRVLRPGWRIRPSFGMGLAVASFIVLLMNPYYLNYFKPGKSVQMERVYLEMLQDERFMAEIENLEENSLPRFYVEISDYSDQDALDDLKESKLPGGQDEKIATYTGRNRNI